LHAGGIGLEIGEVMKRNIILKEILALAKSLVIAVVCVLIIQNTLIVHALVVSSSMEGTVMTGSRIMGSRIAYLANAPERFDIILFQAPDGDTTIPYLKRIIGLPNEKVEIRDGKVYIDDSDIPLDDFFIKEEARGNYGPFMVPEDHYFVLGDNRNNSYDSKNWANTYLARDRIQGKIYIEYFPTPHLLE